MNYFQFKTQTVLTINMHRFRRMILTEQDQVEVN